MIDGYAPLWARIFKIPIYIILLPFGLIHLILFKERICSKCYKKIWRFQKSVRKEEPNIIDNNWNFPRVNMWHFECYKKLKKR